MAISAEHTEPMGALVVVVTVALVLVIGLLVGVPWFFNRLSPTVDGRRRARNDDYFLADQCSTGLMSRYRRLNRRLPADPRCKFCLVPFAGVGRVLRIRPSRKNPNFCMGCFEMAPIGGTDMDVGVLFADLRGFTSWCEHQPPSAVERALNRFYTVTTAVITEADGLVDKLVGDEVMGLFLTAFRSLGDRTCDVMVVAAEEIVRRLHASADADERLPVGIGLNFGMARVGNVGVGEVKDFTAVGDVVNTAARLQVCAAAGEIVMAEAVYEQVRERYPALTHMDFEVKGKTDAVGGRVLAVDKPKVP
jgi:adenylate cyclase